MESVIASVET